MPINSTHREDPAQTDHDPRWQLVERIVQSQCFAKSERLSSFLTCICEMARRGELDQINEQYIGTTVFGRRPDYDPSADSIVRSHASRLRHRLDRYFAEEGAEEQWTLTIPKGSYLPVFHLRPGTGEAVAEYPRPAGTLHTQPRSSLGSSVAASLPAVPTDAARPAAARRSRLLPALTGALVFTTLIAVLSAAAWFRDRRAQSANAVAISETRPLFWSHLFSPKDPTIVVIADSGLVMLQGITKQSVDLPMYLNGTYLSTIPDTSANQQARNLATRRYTSMVDLTIMSKVLRMTGIDLHNTRFVYSRDLRPSEIKHGNIVILGTYESTPWVQLFEPGMNFYFQNDLARGVFSAMNRHPRPGELPAYDSRFDDPNKTVYGVVAYRPSLNGSDKVLILEGQSMAGTESASDFVFDDGYLLPFLESIRRPDGTIPYFEVLLRSRSMSGESSRLELVATRIEDQ